jgi:hypothetical protein
MIVRINPGERQKIMEQNFLTSPASRGNEHRNSRVKRVGLKVGLVG